MYVIIILLFLNCNRLFTIWMLLELNTLMFSLLILRYKEDINTIMYYFLLQSLGSFAFLVSLINLVNPFFSSILIAGAMVAKAGIFPLSFWFYKVSKVLRNNSFIFLLTIQKIPSFIIIFSNRRKIFLYMFVLNLILGSLFLFFRKEMKDCLVSSSIYITYWNFIIFTCSTYIFYFFYLAYRSTIYFGLKLSSYFSIFQQSYSVTGVLLLMFFLIGLPPFRIFFLKFYFLRFACHLLRWVHLTLIWVFSFLCIIGYFNLFFKNLERVNSLGQHSFPNWVSLARGFMFLFIIFCIFY